MVETEKPEEKPKRKYERKVAPETNIVPMIKCKLAHPDATMPTKSVYDDCGFDLYATSEIVVPSKDCKPMDFGIQFEIPVCEKEGYYYGGFIYARSGLGSNDGIRPRNCVGVIDRRYRGNIRCMVENNGDNYYIIRTGDRIAQIVFEELPIVGMELVTELNMEDDRGGGFGSSGK